MKKHISTDEYFQLLGVITMAKHHDKERDRYANIFTKMLEDKEEDQVIWNYIFEDDSATKIWEDIIKDKEIKVGGIERSKTKQSI